MIFRFIDPGDAIRAIAASVGREARKQIVFEAVQAWVDEIPEQELVSHYAKAIADLDDWDFTHLVELHGKMNCGPLIPNRDALVKIFPSLGDRRREVLKIAAGLRGEEAFEAGYSEEQTLETVLPCLSRERSSDLADSCASIWVSDRVGCFN